MRACISLAAAGLTALAASASSRAAEPWPIPASNRVRNFASTLAGLEPSDVVWHPRLRRLFIVSDNGPLVEMSPEDGQITGWWWISGDIEGVTYADPESPYVYIGQENWPKIIEFNIKSGQRGREWSLPQLAFSEDNQRLEALTFLPNRYCTRILRPNGLPYNAGRGSVYGSGGLFLAGHQGSGRIFVYDVNLAANGILTFINTVGPIVDSTGALGDLSGLSFDRATGIMYAVWDSPQRFGALNVLAPGFLPFHIWWLPPENAEEEGITIIHNPCTPGFASLVIANDQSDRHDLWIYDGLAVPPLVNGDLNEDGRVDTADIAYLITALLNSEGDTMPCGADVNHDGHADGDDISTMMGLLSP